MSWGVAVVKWSDGLSVGVSSLDEQHKKMFGLLNDLHEGIMSGREKIGLGDILNQLIVVTAAHIKYEEALLARLGYDAAAHVQEHAALMQQVFSIRREYERIGPSAMTLPVLGFLKNRISAHIASEDMRYRGAVVAGGAK